MLNGHTLVEPTMASEFQVSGHNAVAPFTLKLHRDSPCDELEDRKATTGLRRLRHRVQGTKWRQVLRFEEPSRFPRCLVDPNMMSTMLSPIQKFRWVHFPRNVELLGSGRRS